MVFISKEPEPISGRDCKDFKAKFWDRGHCKLMDKCACAGSFTEEGYFPSYCKGIAYKMRSHMPLEEGTIIKGGRNEKPTRTRPKNPPPGQGGDAWKAK